jgi:hypothetical protein
MSPVKNLSPFFRRIAKFLLVAIMLQAVLPSFAAQHNAKNGLSASGWVEVCSAQGSKWVAQDNHPGSSQHASAHADHCVFCSATGAGAEFDATRYIPPSDITSSGVQITQHDAASIYAGHVILSRAPPSHS